MRTSEIYKQTLWSEAAKTRTSIIQTYNSNDPTDLAYAYSWENGPLAAGVFLNWVKLGSFDPIALELIILHETFHLLYDDQKDSWESENKAWEYGAKMLARMHYPLIPIEPVRKLFDDHPKLLGRWKDLVLETLVNESYELWSQLKSN
jgi:hypothetical protein